MFKMHQHRRRKKRPSYGVRTVEISRGKNGFGFTISGQAPCILSCIINGSPAEKAGLRPGDFLIAVNGKNVSKAPHDDVVRLIGNSTGILKLQIAENYYSDSSEDEFISVVKLRPKYSHKVRHRQQHNSVSRAEKVVQDLQTGALFVDHIHGVIDAPEDVPHESKNSSGLVESNCRSNKALLDLILQHKLHDVNNENSLLNIHSQNLINHSTTKSKQPAISRKKEPKVMKCRSHPEHLNTSGTSSNEIFHSIFTEQDLNNILYPAIFATQNRSKEMDENQERAILKAVVGYLGTIEMPKEPQLPNSRLQTIRNCIRRLRIEKKVHTLVLMTVFPESIILINPQGLTLAEFAAEKISFSGVYSDDKKFFGLVTNHGNSSDEFSEGSQEDPIFNSSSCHVFMVDPKLAPHHQHAKRAKTFHITCTLDPLTNKCKEFPESADIILQAVVGLYRSRLGLSLEAAHELEFHANMSPQPSNTSSNSSNSDSGIGFRDEGNTSDRVFIVDVDNYPQYCTNSLDRQAFTTHRLGILDGSLCSFSLSQENCISVKQGSQAQENKTNTPTISNCHLDKLTVRAMPDPVGFEKGSTAHISDQTDSQQNSTSMRNNIYKFLQLKNLPCCEKMKKSRCHLRFGSGNLKNNPSVLDLQQNNPHSSVVDFNIDKLSPKVYGLNFTVKSVDGIDICNNPIDSVSWECNSCSTEEILPQELHIMHDCQDMTEQEEDGSQDVHPPTQEEDDSETEHSGVEHSLEVTKKWARTSSLRRHLGRKRSFHRNTHEAGTVSDGELASGKISTASSILVLDHISNTSRRSSCVSERPMDIGRVASWAASFSTLLEDSAGLHIFSEFLKKEFSQENITFWTACERYRQLTDQSDILKTAKEIYNRHLCIGAQEPVNVDSHARQIAQEGLDSPTADLFIPAQKQIFNLMKFDCYQRFLKSSMFKESMLCEMQGQPLPYQALDTNEEKEKIKQKVTEDKKRKSIIPWHRLSKMKSNDLKTGRGKLIDRQCDIRKSLKKKKKRELPKLDDTSSTQSDLTSSRSSLTSSENGAGLVCKNILSRESLNAAELSLFPNHCGSDGLYCRVILPDCSTTVVRTQKGETVGEMLLKLLEKRCLNYNAVEAYIVGSCQPLDHGVAVTTLSCKEIKVEQVILFCLELPNKKTIGVKAKSGKMCGEILKPVLQKYGYKFENVVVIIASSQERVSQCASITSIDNQRICVHMRNTHSEISGWNLNDLDHLQGDNIKTPPIFPDLEELTNQIFDDLQKNRLEYQLKNNDLGVIDLNSDINSKVQGSKSICDLDSVYKPSDLKMKQKSESSFVSKLYSLNGLMQSQNNALLPYNPVESNNFPNEYNDGWKPMEININDSKQIDMLCEANDIVLEKENYPLSESHIKNLVNCDEKLKSQMLSSYENRLSLSSTLKNVDNEFDSNCIYPNHMNVQDYFSGACQSHYDYDRNRQSEKFLRNLGILSSIKNNQKLKKTSPLPDSVSFKAHCTQSTNSIPRPMSHIRPSSKKMTGGSQKSQLPSPIAKCIISPSSEMDSTLVNNEKFDLDLDVDITLQTHSHSATDISLTASRSPFSNDINSSPVCTEDRNFPQALFSESISPELCHIDADISFPQLTVHLPEPPPVPPKAILRGPPPRPPSRQFTNVTSGFCAVSENDSTDEGNEEHYGSERCSQNQTCKKVLTSFASDCKDFSISFV